MNGARSIFMRKGYWLTALAAIVLLAASSGTAYAQLTTTAPKTVEEGDSVTMAVTLKGFIPAGTVRENDQADPVQANETFDVTVTWSIPAGVATDTVTPGEEGEGVDISTVLNTPGVITFEIEENDTLDRVPFSETRMFTVQTLQDVDAEDEAFLWSFSVISNVDMLEDEAGEALVIPTLPPLKLTIEDDETQTYVLDVTTEDPKEGTTIAVTLKAEPRHVQGKAVLTLHLDDGEYSWTNDASDALNDDPITLGSSDGEPLIGALLVAQNMAAITIQTPTGGDGNRDEDSVTLTAYSGAVGRATPRASVTIKVADADALPAVAMMVTDDKGEPDDPQPTSVTEGDTIYVVVTVVDKDEDAIAAEEDLTVALMPTGTADSADYTVVGSSDIKMLAKMSGVIKIEVRGEDDDVGRESLMFDAEVSGDPKVGPGTRTSPAVLSLYIEDATTPQITPKSSDADYDRIKAATADLNPGETVELMTSDLFTVTDGFNAGYSVSVEGDSVSAFASGEVVTINAEIAGESKITVTGTASMSTSSLIPSQTVSNVASLTFPVMVEDTTLSVTVSADPMEIAEGGTSMITATASREITVGDGAVEIDLTVVGDGELDADSIMIAMGDMSGSAMLTATEDDADFEDETVTVVATGSGIEGTMQVEVAVTDNDEAPPDSNQISAKDQDEAYPVIMAAIAAGAGEDEMLTPGESVELMASDLFTVMDGYDATYRVSVDSAAVSGLADGDSISVTAVSAGDAKVTITGTATMMAASSFDASQDATNVASITFPVTVEAEPEPVVPEPVPALPLIAQWLLGLGLMGGGARQLFRRRRQG